MANTELTINLDEVRIQINALMKRISGEVVRAAVGTAFQRGATKIGGFIAKNFLSGQVLNRRTGNLARSVEGIYEVSEGLPRLRVGVFKSPARNYARMQEFGGTITPKKAKSLAVPVGAGAITPAGVSKYDSPRQYPGELQYIPINRGNLVALLVDPKEKRKAEGERMKATYLLLRRVRVKARPFLRPGVMAFLPELTQEVGRSIRKVLDIDVSGN
jgi:hypothetical protein